MGKPVECPYCNYRQTGKIGYSMIRCKKCGKLFPLKKRTKENKQLLLR